MDGNLNHPKKGDRITVEPIRGQKDIEAIKRLLADRPRDLCLFTFGVNTNLRASDLLRLTIGQVRGKMPGDGLLLKEKKTGNKRHITLNEAVTDSVNSYLAACGGNDGERLFRGIRGPLTVPSVHRLVKGWCRAVGLKGNYGSHTLRKTWGYHARVTFGESIPVLMAAFGHSSQEQTLAYLCVQPEELEKVYMNRL
ncbi:MAG: tyrosine-type recombinase/integrase [Deltaproteobacteria bacterium]|nr:tyrosine-type recombinase/integrase [Deltaproteobacteria bacterium]